MSEREVELTSEERDQLTMGISTGCGCAPDGLCSNCGFILPNVVPATEAIVAARLADAEARAEAAEAKVAHHTCPSTCVEQNHPGREHDDWLPASSEREGQR